ncbi:MAG: aldehyde dehydrogenase family protein, partial [Aeromicrobium sp.]
MSETALLNGSLLNGGLFIGGTWSEGSDGSFVVDDPATGNAIATVANGTVADAVAAVDAAAVAFPTWRAVPTRERSEILRRCFEFMVRDADKLTALIAAENGKPLADARSEVIYAAEFFRWFAEEAVRAGGSYGASPAGGTRTVVTHRPVGVAALVTPWNFPAAMA